MITNSCRTDAAQCAPGRGQRRRPLGETLGLGRPSAGAVNPEARRPGRGTARRRGRAALVPTRPPRSGPGAAERRGARVAGSRQRPPRTNVSTPGPRVEGQGTTGRAGGRAYGGVSLEGRARPSRARGGGSGRGVLQSSGGGRRVEGARSGFVHLRPDLGLEAAAPTAVQGGPPTERPRPLSREESERGTTGER